MSIPREMRGSLMIPHLLNQGSFQEKLGVGKTFIIEVKQLLCFSVGNKIDSNSKPLDWNCLELHLHRRWFESNGPMLYKGCRSLNNNLRLQAKNRGIISGATNNMQQVRSWKVFTERKKTTLHNVFAQWS